MIFVPLKGDSQKCQDGKITKGSSIMMLPLNAGPDGGAEPSHQRPPGQPAQVSHPVCGQYSLPSRAHVVLEGMFTKRGLLH